VVVAVMTEISEKKSEIEELQSKISLETQKLEQLKLKQEKLLKDGDALYTSRNISKAELDKQYRASLKEPNIDLAPFQKKYYIAKTDIKEYQSLLLDNKQAINDAEVYLRKLQGIRGDLENDLINLAESKIVARVKRLSKELREPLVNSVDYTTTCAENVSLAGCVEQAREGAYLESIETWKKKFIDNITESKLVKSHSQGARLNVEVLERQYTDIRVSDENTVSLRGDFKLQIQADTTAECDLLNVSRSYCRRLKIKIP